MLRLKETEMVGLEWLSQFYVFFVGKHLRGSVTLMNLPFFEGLI